MSKISGSLVISTACQPTSWSDTELMVDAILIRHQGLRRVPIHSGDLDVLRRQWPRLEEISIEPPTCETFAQFDESYPWEEAAQQQAEQFHTLEATRDAYPEAPLLYMGFVAVPLAVHLGSLLGQAARVEIFQHQPEARNWIWPKQSATRQLLRPPSTSPADPNSTRDVLLRVSGSAEIPPAKTQTLASRCHVCDVAVGQPSPAAIQSQADLFQLAHAFRRTLDQSIAAFPGARVRHLVAAVPVGAALALGMQLSPTKHLPVQTWKYLGHRERPYARALCVGETIDRPRVLLLGAAPMDRTGISAPAEIQGLRDLLERHPEQLSVVGRPAAGVRDLTALLGELNPTLVHVGSHGRVEDGPVPAALTLSTPDGFSTEIPLEDLIRLLKRAPKLQCVVLAACHSALIAERLSEDVPAAIGFEGALFDPDARAFSSGFWKSLVSGRSVAEAFEDGRLELDESRRHQARLFPIDDPRHRHLIPI